MYLEKCIIVVEHIPDKTICCLGITIRNKTE